MGGKKKKSKAWLQSPLEDKAMSWKAFRKKLDAKLDDEPPPPKVRRPGWILGVDEDGGDYVIPYTGTGKERQGTLYGSHVHCIGRTGYGKSFLLYSLICQTILAEPQHGVVVIDPEGSLYSMVLNFLVQQNIDPKRVTLINAENPDWTARVNPLQQEGLGPKVAREAMLLAVGDTDFQHTPLLRKFAYAATVTAKHFNLPMSLTGWLLSRTQAGEDLRRRAIEEIPVEVMDSHHVRHVWQQFEASSRREQHEDLDSTASRIAAFAEETRLLQMLTFTDDNLDWQKELDDKSIVLCNLGQASSDPMDPEHLKLLAGLLIHGVIAAAYQRQANQDNHCFVFCDECPSYMDKQVADAIAQLRKRGVHFVLAHQTIDQIRLENPLLWSAICGCCDIKILFGGLQREDAQFMAKEVFTGQVHGDNIKYQSQVKSQRTVMKWQDIVSHTTGENVSRTHTDGYSRGESKGGSTARTGASTSGHSVMYAPDGFVFMARSGITESESFSTAINESRNWSQSQQWSESDSVASGENRSTSVTRMPSPEFEDFLQDPSIMFYTLEEEWEKRYDQLMRLPPQQLVVKRGTQQPAVAITVYTIADVVATQEQLNAYELQVFQLSPYVIETRCANDQFTNYLEQYGFGGSVLVEPGTLDAAGVAPQLPDLNLPEPGKRTAAKRKKATVKKKSTKRTSK